MTTQPKFSTAKDVIEFAHAEGIQIVDLKFTDLPGTMQHFSVPVSELTEKDMAKGYGFDGSSIRGFQQIHESDMLLIPDPSTAAVDTVYQIPTLHLICDVIDPGSREYYSRDPRWVARKAELYLKENDIADVSYWGPELEHFVFDSVRYNQNAHEGYYFIDSEEGIWNTGNKHGPNLGYRPRHKEGYFPTAPTDTLQDFRSEVILKMAGFGIYVEKHHHEVATAGQGEIDMRYDSLTKMADNVMIQKYIIKNVARAHGKVANFMPKPLFGDNGSGMHTHQSLWRNGVNLFYDGSGYAGLSEMALHYIGGLIHHTPSILAFAAPTTNSYRRLVPGFEAPVNLAYSARNRSACCRIPMYFPDPAGKRVEYRPPDPTCNPYLAFAAMLMAGVDGIINKIDPGKPMDLDLYNLSPRAAAKIKRCPGSLDEVLIALERDQKYLLRGGIFTKDLISTWIEYKREREVDPVRLRPHPYEFFLYSDT